MSKPVSCYSAGLLGGVGLCLMALPTAVRAQGTTPSTFAVANPGAAANVETPAPDGNKPDEANAGAGDTEILASQGATFAAKDRIAVFSGDVRVRDPRFTLACDKLTVYLSRGAVPGASPSPAPSSTPPPVDPTTKDGPNRSSGIDHAVAEGHVIIIQKHAPTKPGEEEKMSVGRADSAEYDSKNGDMTLRGMPKIEQNGNSTEALSWGTIFILHSDNSLDIKGPSRTHIIERTKDKGTPGGKPAGSPAANRRPQAGATP